MSDFRTKVFRLWFRLSRSMTLGVRAVVENDSKQVLLVRHTYVPGLHLPGGGVEKGEPASLALSRELQEEAGVECLSPAALAGVYSNHSSFKNDHILLYRISNWRSVTAENEGEIAEIVWSDPLAPPADTSDGTLRRFNEIYRGVDKSDFW